MHQRGFADPRWANQAVGFARRNPQVQITEQRHTIDGFSQMVYFDSIHYNQFTVYRLGCVSATH